MEKIFDLQATPEALAFFYAADREKEIARISPSENFACLTTRLLKRPAKSAFKRLILTMPLCQHLLLSMSSTLTSVELSDADCEKGQVTQRPPIAYAQSKSGTALMSTRETIKMKTPEGESKQNLLGDGADGEEYVKHLMSFHR